MCGEFVLEWGRRANERVNYRKQLAQLTGRSHTNKSTHTHHADGWHSSYSAVPLARKRIYMHAYFNTTRIYFHKDIHAKCHLYLIVLVICKYDNVWNAKVFGSLNSILLCKRMPNGLGAEKCKTVSISQMTASPQSCHFVLLQNFVARIGFSRGGHRMVCVSAIAMKCEAHIEILKMRWRSHF